MKTPQSSTRSSLPRRSNLKKVPNVSALWRSVLRSSQGSPRDPSHPTHWTWTKIVSIILRILRPEVTKPQRRILSPTKLKSFNLTSIKPRMDSHCEGPQLTWSFPNSLWMQKHPLDAKASKGCKSIQWMQKHPVDAKASKGCKSIQWMQKHPRVSKAVRRYLRKLKHPPDNAQAARGSSIMGIVNQPAISMS